MQKITPQLEKEAVAYLIEKDPVLGKVIFAVQEKVGPMEWRFDMNYFLALAESIVSQQLSVKAADTIWKRFVALSEDPDVTAHAIIQIPDQKIRDAGLSWAKVKYVKDLAQRVVDSPKMFEHFDEMSNEEIIEELVKVKGIGQWTAEMFLMFRMGRPDLFSYGDLGLRNAIKNLYPIRGELSEKKAIKIAENWKPYRTIACRYLWKSFDI